MWIKKLCHNKHDKLIIIIIQPGDRIYATKSSSGSFAQFALTEAAQTFSLHPNLDFDQGAALGIPYFTAYRAVVQRLHARGGQTLLVHGASGAVSIYYYYTIL